LRGSLDIGIRKAKTESYSTSELGYSLIQAYTDDMILISDSKDKLQKLIVKAQNFFDFANIKLNPNKYEVMAVNPNRNTKNLVIGGVRNEY
jgi:hypothetical protein